MGAASGRGTRKVVVVGAGIAGMTAALYLIRAGFDVTILERADHVGGKFGAIEGRHGAVHEHAYHFLGDWCVNFWDVVHEIGLSKSDDFRASKGVKFLRHRDRGGPVSARLSTLRLDRLRTDFSRSVDSGVIPPDDMVIWFYSLLDLVSHGRDLDDKEFLNRISVNGFMRSLPYMTDLAALLHQEALLKAFAVPSYETSARSYRRFARFFSRDQDGWLLNQDVNRKFWPHFRAAVRRAGASPIRCRTSLETIQVERRGRDAWVSGITLGPTDADNPWEKDAVLLVTVPHGDLASIVERSPRALREAAPRLLDLRKLTSTQMASLDVYFRRRLPGVPAEHVTLIDDRHVRKPGPDRKERLGTYGNRLASRFALSFVDNYQAWHGHRAEETWLNVVSADFGALAGLDKDEARDAMLDELAQYLEFGRDDVDDTRTELQPNADQPLFTNTVGSWQYRPEPGFYRDARSGVAFDNLCLAGDYCRSEVDIVCLEGAVLTARKAAHAVAEHAGARGTVAEAEVPAEVSDRAIARLKQELEPLLRLAARRSFGARGDLADVRDPLERAESWKRLLDLWGERVRP